MLIKTNKSVNTGRQPFKLFGNFNESNTMLLFHHLFIRLLAGIFIVFPLFASPQSVTVKDGLLLSLDSVAQGSSPARDFAIIYLKTTIGAKQSFEKDSESIQGLMDRFENRFGQYFLNAAIAYRDSATIPHPWQQYYANPKASALRHILHGINAHINSDLWQALVQEFTLDEIRLLKKHYYSFHRYLRNDYEDIYEYAVSVNPAIRRLHTVSLGADRWYGGWLLKKWRKRQMQIAELYYTNTNKFEKKKKRVNRKLAAINRLIAVYF